MRLPFPRPVVAAFSLACAPVAGAWAEEAATATPAPAPTAAPAPAPAPAPAAAFLAKLKPSLYGFVEVDAVWDSTQSFTELAGNTLVARPGTWAHDHARMQMSARNSRLGFKLEAPETNGVKAVGTLEFDLFANQPPGLSEPGLYSNAGVRLRHANVKLETSAVDVLVGQSWHLFGWQTYFHPNAVQIQGLPGQLFSRAPQVRVGHTFKTEAVNVEAAVAAVRPAQRDSAVPDVQAGVRVLLNQRKALRTIGSATTQADAGGLGLSGVARRFTVPEFTAAPSKAVSATGWGYSIDALLPVIPGSLQHHQNALAVTASFVRGEGIADLYTSLTGGVGYPALPNPDNTTPAPTYSPGLDAGLMTFDAAGQPHLVGWQTAMVGVQYFLPCEQRVWLAGNAAWVTATTADQFVSAKMLVEARFANGGVFTDLTPTVRVGVDYSYFEQHFKDGVLAADHRGQATLLYLF